MSKDGVYRRWCLISLLCAIGLVIPRATPRAQSGTLNRFVFQFAWGSEGQNNGQFQSPHAVAIAADGTVYVTDMLNSRIQRFSPEGAFLGKWGSLGTSNGQFHTPAGLAVAANGTVYVADASNNRVQRFSATGTYLGTIGVGQLRSPYGVAVAPDGTAYVADTWNHRIQRYSAVGQLLSQWGSEGSGNGQFKWPSGISISSNGMVYVADQYNHRIQRFRADGVFLGQWGFLGTGDGQFRTPVRVTVAPDGTVYVVDTGNHRIQRFSATGAFLGVFGSKGTHAGRFEDPTGIAVASDSRIYVADQNNHRIQALRPAGQSHLPFIVNPGWRPPGLTLEITVLRAGRPVRHLGVFLDGQGFSSYGTTDANGIVRFHDLSTGTYLARYDGYEIYTYGSITLDSQPGSLVRVNLPAISTDLKLVAPLPQTRVDAIPVLRWDSYPEAAYYRVHLWYKGTESTSWGIWQSWRTDGNWVQVTRPLDPLYDYAWGVYGFWSDDSMLAVSGFGPSWTLNYGTLIELAHDDGGREAWAGGAQGSVMAVRYALSPPARVHSARFFLGGEMRPMRFIVWNGAWQELYSQTLTPNAPSGGGWWTWTLPAGVMGPQSEVYVGYQCLSNYSASGPWLGYDTSQPNGETHAGPWPPQRRTDGNAMIRVTVQ